MRGIVAAFAPAVQRERYWIATSSMSNTSVASGGITPPAPREP
jgi:hypothetical protein